MPKPENTGATCIVCKLGDIIRTEDFFPEGELVIGGPTPGKVVETYHCNCCGIAYKFPPPATVSEPAAPQGKIQVAPGQFVTPRHTDNEQEVHRRNDDLDELARNIGPLNR